MCEMIDAMREVREAACALSAACLTRLLAETGTVALLAAPDPELADLMRQVSELP